MKRNILLFLCAFLATIGVCAGVFILEKRLLQMVTFLPKLSNVD